MTPYRDRVGGRLKARLAQQRDRSPSCLPDAETVPTKLEPQTAVVRRWEVWRLLPLLPLRTPLLLTQGDRPAGAASAAHGECPAGAVRLPNPLPLKLRDRDWKHKLVLQTLLLHILMALLLLSPL